MDGLNATLPSACDTSFCDRMATGNQAAPTSAADGWTDHPCFAGVHLKPLVRGSDAGGLLTTLMVRLDPGAVMKPHGHETQAEQHFVVAGGGCADLDGRTIPYAPGAVLAIPRGMRHSVRAGETGMVLMAVFAPGTP